MTGGCQQRSAPAQQPPPDAAVLRDRMPTATLPLALFREHGRRVGAADLGCWWFADTGEGRFDLPEPDGTCYFGETVGVAVRERCGRLLAMGLPVSEALYRGRVVTEVPCPQGAAASADLAHPDAVLAGVTGELAATSDYRLTQDWAAALRAAGFGSLRYSARFTPGGEQAVAVFGPAGANHRRPVTRSRDLLEVLRELGYPTVRSDQMSSASLHVTSADLDELT